MSAKWIHVNRNVNVMLTGFGAVGSSQGMAFTLEERQQLGIHGLLPPCFLTQDVQVLRVMKSYETRINPLDK